MMNEHQTKKLRDIPESRHKMYEKAVTTKSPRRAIKIFCLECCAYLPKQVDGCSSMGCPLYPYRLGGWPGKGDKKPPANPNAKRPDFKSFRPSKTQSS